MTPLGRGLIMCILSLNISKGILKRVPVVTAAAVAQNLLIQDGPKKKYEFSLHQSKTGVIAEQIPASLHPFAIAPRNKAPSCATLKRPSKKCL